MMLQRVRPSCAVYPASCYFPPQRAYSVWARWLPIFRDGLGQWRRYDPWLGPLKEALGPALEGGLA